MLIPPSASVSTNLLFPVLMWTFSPTNTGKDGSFFVGWHKFCNSSPFSITLLKRISYVILVDILNRLADKLPLKSPPSNIILVNFLSLSGTHCSCLFIDTSPSKNSYFSNNLILFDLAV